MSSPSHLSFMCRTKRTVQSPPLLHFPLYFFFFFNQYPVIPLNTGRGSALNTNNNNRLPPSHFSWLQNCMFSQFYVVSFQVSNSHFQSKWKAVEIYLMTWQCRGAVQGTTFQNIHLTSEQCRRPRGTFRHIWTAYQRTPARANCGKRKWSVKKWKMADMEVILKHHGDVQLRVESL